MKRFYLYFGLLLLLGGVTLTSCLKKKNPYGEVDNGFALVNTLQPQNEAAIDPLNIAFRLNTLLATVEKQIAENPGENITIDNVEVPNKSGTIPPTRNLKKMLFGDAELEESTVFVGAWIITYKLNNLGIGAGESDKKRRGEVTVYTGGKLLKDLGDADVWNITTGKGLNAYQLITDMETSMFCDIFSYEIIKSAQSSWMATVISTAFMGGDPSVSRGWEATYTMTQSGGGGQQDYESTLNSTYKFDTIIGNGYVAVYNVDATYSAKDLTYSPNCANLSTPYTGSESITVNIDSATIPSNKVRVSYGGDAKNCNRYYLLTYNGYTYDSRTGVVTGGDS